MPLPYSPLASSRLAGFGHAVPSRLVPNAEIEAMLGLSDGWIERRSGIRSRYYASEGETLSNLAARAGQQALEDARIVTDDIAMTLLATSTPDHLLPPSAPLLAHRLGLAKSGAVDLAGACGGFVYALALADGFVRTQGKAVLVVAANILSRRINPEERNSAILFADGAGAVVLAPCYDGQSGIKSTVLTADGSGYGLISIPAGGSNQPFTPETPAHGVLMTMGDGREVFTRAVDMMTQSAQQAMAEAGLAAGDIDRFIPHQANARMCDKVRQNLGLEAEKMVNTMAEFGNSSAATIPLSLSVEHRRKPLQPGERLLFTAAGAGFTGGAIVLTV